jgi:hypothetical protein
MLSFIAESVVLESCVVMVEAPSRDADPPESSLQLTSPNANVQAATKGTPCMLGGKVFIMPLAMRPLQATFITFSSRANS